MSSRLAAFTLALLTSAAVHAAPSTAPSPVGVRLHGQARGLRGPVTVKLRDGAAVEVAADGAFALPGTLAVGVTFELEVSSQPPGVECHLTPASGKASGREVRVSLECREAPLAARPLVPAERAAGVSPLLGRAVLVLTRPMAEPPAGTFLLEAKDGEAWIDTGLEAVGEYKPETREWRFTLAAHAFPPSKVLRVTIVPTAGKDAKGEPLAREPIRWTFTTGVNPLDAARGKPDGGCVVGGVDSKAAQPVPCDKP
jgi:hypothetical protein